jgi:hypothetical protein
MLLLLLTKDEGRRTNGSISLSFVIRLWSFVTYYTAKQKPPYQRSDKAACQPGASRQAKLNQTQGPAVGAARIVPRVCALLARYSFRLALSIAVWRAGVKI